MIDIGSNLMDGMFQGWYHGKKAHEADLDQVLLRSRRANVTRQIVTAGNLQESRHGVELVAKHGTSFSFGWSCEEDRLSEYG